MKYLITSTLLLALGLSACVYEPEQFEEKSAESSNSGASSDIGTVYSINSGKQICNPSITQDTVNYPGAMLWLNFGGKLNVSPKDSGYTISGVYQHDRITVTNQDNEVQWYLMTDSSECQFQDPEWTTHPNFVVATSADTTGSKGCTDLDYGIFTARMSDHKRFWLVEKGMGEFTCPHVWVDPSVTEPDTSASDTTIQGFFGTENVRLVFVDKSSVINFVDYANGGMKKAIKLKKSPEMEKENWTPDSPLISPDGKFIVFNVVKGPGNNTVMKSYIQKLSETSAPVEIERTADMMGEPMQPHWFKYGERLFVTWAEVPDDVFFIKSDFSLAVTQDGSVGRTAMREISLDANAPADLAMQWIGPVTEVAPIPTTGGRSADGKYLATGYANGFMLELP
ncbi:MULTISPECIES: hypothetical protein [unclassified Fibrobacter]|uniref:hypothetical protein n=1 Tax=unclassified Fibrobacter TaxID=2634177 RepID=UPI000D6AA3FE|nr:MULTISPECIES: hypothetical protein [unclassified Fibrobacter]PWJ69072.1 hypothetical protein BGX12_10535 [Fibrobacter sp. UWR4]PZW72903.1 hypothetical protein C8E88_100535 [Fibrobacter sp. UWR1]